MCIRDSAESAGPCILLHDNSEQERILKNEVAQLIAFDPVGRESSPSVYPNSLMGVLSVIRQTFLKVQHAQETLTFEKRNKFLTNLAIDQKGNTLVLFQYVEKHGKVLYDMIRSKVDSNRKVFFVSGETATADREAIRTITENQKNAIVVASMGVFSTGVNIRNLHNIVFSSPSKSQIRVLQSIGRGLRKSDTKSSASLYDIADDLTFKERKNYTLNHFMERVKIYSSEQFPYHIYTIPIKG